MIRSDPTHLGSLLLEFLLAQLYLPRDDAIEVLHDGASRAL